MLQALVRKTERIREQLGSAGQVIAFRVNERLARDGIWRSEALAKMIDADEDEGLHDPPSTEMDDAIVARRERQAKEIDDLRKTLEARARARRRR